ncbi:MAG: carbohydrate kinase [Verrucomicrobia bacterium]|nr:carbohydrate kinase [Cytophagales bacterium]
MLLIGYDIGSSSVKACLLDAESGNVLASAQSPTTEMSISAPEPDWAEQDPLRWWEHLKNATAQLRTQTQVDFKGIKAIGISYQMHGLVITDSKQQVLRPAIIWCDSRAVSIGNQALHDLGREKILSQLLNAPGNFTASKLRWVLENEPELFQKIYKAMLPGDYIAMKLSGTINTTASGLSEGIFWNFQEEKIADFLLDYYQIPIDKLPEMVPTFGLQSKILPDIASELGLSNEVFITYRAGDQPNNAFSLNVLNPGEVAATAGTSGVIYGITEQKKYDELSRVNTFLHVNHQPEKPRYGVLLCINGTGILNNWLRQNIMSENHPANIYQHMNDLASKSPVGASGLSVLPFGNGAERVLQNRQLNASFHGLNFSVHTRSHLLRAAQEGIVYALKYGLDAMQTLGVEPVTVRAGKTNMFMSDLFAEAFANVTHTEVRLYNTDGAAGAARAAGIGIGLYKNFQEAFGNLKVEKIIEPDKNLTQVYQDAYQRWFEILQKSLA